MTFDLTSSDGVKAYLRQTPFPATSVTPLVGGNGNFTYRATLEKPFVHSATSEATISHVVLKHAEPYVATNPNFPLEVERQDFEILAYKEIPEVVSPVANVSLPTIYYEDVNNRVVIMQDCGKTSMTLKEYLRHSPPSIDSARHIGCALGQFLGELHLVSHQSQPADSPGVLLKEKFSKNVQARHISAYITYGLVKRRLNPTTNPHFDEITALIESKQDEIKRTNQVLVMGDFWPGNILVHGDSMDQLTIIDWELSKPGLAGLDVGQFLAELYTARNFYPWSHGVVDEMVSSFIQSYKSVVSSIFDLEEIAEVATAHVGAHLIAITPVVRPKWGSDEMINAVISEGYTFLLNAGNEQWRRECFLKELCKA